MILHLEIHSSRLSVARFRVLIERYTDDEAKMETLKCNSQYQEDEQKKIERKVFGHFFDAAGSNLGLSEWIQCDKPDFICRNVDGRVIGIEVFDYIRGEFGKHGSTERRIESTAFQIEKEITAKIKRNFPSPFYCSASFQPDVYGLIKSRGSTIKAFSEELFSKICEIVEKMDGDKVHFWHDEMLENGLYNYVFEMAIDRSADRMGYHGFSHNIGGAIYFDEEAFRKRVEEKEKRLSAYLNNCDECWILGMAYGPYVSSNITLKSVPQVKFETGFGKVVLYVTPNDYKVF